MCHYLAVCSLAPLSSNAVTDGIVLTVLRENTVSGHLYFMCKLVEIVRLCLQKDAEEFIFVLDAAKDAYQEGKPLISAPAYTSKKKNGKKGKKGKKGKNGQETENPVAMAPPGMHNPEETDGGKSDLPAGEHDEVQHVGVAASTDQSGEAEVAECVEEEEEEAAECVEEEAEEEEEEVSSEECSEDEVSSEEVSEEEDEEKTAKKKAAQKAEKKKKKHAAKKVAKKVAKKAAKKAAKKNAKK